jgi:hypothetical protein
MIWVSLVRGFRNAYLRFRSNTARVGNVFLRPVLKNMPINTIEHDCYFLKAHCEEFSYPKDRGYTYRNVMRFESI